MTTGSARPPPRLLVHGLMRGEMGAAMDRAAPAAPVATRASAWGNVRSRRCAVHSSLLDKHEAYPTPQNPLYPKPVSSHEGQSTRDCELGGEMGMSGTWLAGR
jgi:hypothetical protein